MSGVAWVRTDVGMLRHPKFLQLKQQRRWQAIVLYEEARLYAGEHGTDGFIAREVAAWLGARPVDIAVLVEAALWDEHGDGGWKIHGWHDKQATSEETQQRSTRAAAAANSRWAKERQARKEALNGTA